MPKRKRKEEEGSKEGVEYKGVYKNGKGFQAQIFIDGKHHFPGTFDTPKEAAEAYDLAAIEAGRPTSKLNFTDQVPKGYVPKRKKLSSNNTIGYRGVYKKGNRFEARIYIGGIQYYIGYFGTTKEAAIAYDVAANHAKRPKSDMNFPDMIHVKEEIPKRKKRKLVNCNNKTNFNGVSKRGKKFVTQIRINGEKEYLGTFTKARAAAMAYDDANVENDRSEKYLNFPAGMPIEDQEPGEIWC